MGANNALVRCQYVFLSQNCFTFVHRHLASFLCQQHNHTHTHVHMYIYISIVLSHINFTFLSHNSNRKDNFIIHIHSYHSDAGPVVMQNQLKIHDQTYEQRKKIINSSEQNDRKWKEIGRVIAQCALKIDVMKTKLGLSSAKTYFRIDCPQFWYGKCFSFCIRSCVYLSAIVCLFFWLPLSTESWICWAFCVTHVFNVYQKQTNHWTLTTQCKYLRRSLWNFV